MTIISLSWQHIGEQYLVDGCRLIMPWWWYPEVKFIVIAGWPPSRRSREVDQCIHHSLLTPYFCVLGLHLWRPKITKYKDIPAIFVFLWWPVDSLLHVGPNCGARGNTLGFTVKIFLCLTRRWLNPGTSWAIIISKWNYTGILVSWTMIWIPTWVWCSSS